MKPVWCCWWVLLQVLTAVKERVEAAEKTIASWSEEKPWITEEETKTATEKVCWLLSVNSGIVIGCELRDCENGTIRTLLDTVWIVFSKACSIWMGHG